MGSVQGALDGRLVLMIGHKDTNEILNTYAALWGDKVDEVAKITRKTAPPCTQESRTEADSPTNRCPVNAIVSQSCPELDMIGTQRTPNALWLGIPVGLTRFELATP